MSGARHFFASNDREEIPVIPADRAWPKTGFFLGQPRLGVGGSECARWAVRYECGQRLIFGGLIFRNSTARDSASGNFSGSRKFRPIFGPQILGQIKLVKIELLLEVIVVLEHLRVLEQSIQK